MTKGFLLAVLASALSIGAAATYAQRPMMTVDIPFRFHFGGKTLPAGQYSVQRVGLGRQGLLLVGGEGQRTIAVVQFGLAGNGASQPRLIFHRIGSAYFLFQVWDADGKGKELPVSRQEQELARRAEITELALSGNSSERPRVVKLVPH